MALEAAWRKVVAEHTSWVWPLPGEIARNCRRVSARMPQSEEAIRREQALALAESYTARYLRKSHLARVAGAEGWVPRLREFVREAAWVQAQLLLGVSGIGWNPAILMPDANEYGSSQSAFKVYQKSIEGAVSRGKIRVAVPPSRCSEWRYGCTTRGCRARIAGNSGVKRMLSPSATTA